jgi:hypothetical protein
MHGFDKNIIDILYAALNGKNGTHFTPWERAFIRRLHRSNPDGLSSKQRAKATEVLRIWRIRKSNKRSGSASK